MGRGIGVNGGIPGGLGNQPWGRRQWGIMVGHLKGPVCVFWNLLTQTVGRGFGGVGALFLPLPPGRGGELVEASSPGHTCV